MKIKMLENNSVIEQAISECVLPNGSAIVTHSPTLRSLKRQRERKVAEVTLGLDTWDVTLVQADESMKMVFNHPDMVLHFSKRIQYTQEEKEYMKSIGIDI